MAEAEPEVKSTADLCDDHGDAVQVLTGGFGSYGGVDAFRGPVSTLAVFEDNTLVRDALTERGDGRVLVVAERSDENTWKSFANLGTVHVLSPGELNAYDVLVSDVVVFTKATLPVAAPAVLKTAPAAPVEASDDFDTGEEE